MATEQPTSKGPDLSQGIELDHLPDGGMIGGHIGDEAALLARRGDKLFAIGANCTHYGGPLPEGLIVGETVRCPWHHACFSLHTGEAIAAPAFNPVPCWRVEKRDGKAYIGDKVTPPKPVRRTQGDHPRRIVIIGGGAAGFAAAEMLRRAGFAGDLTLISSDDAAPYDRPNCSKDYLAGNAPEDWMPLKPPEFYIDQGITLELRTKATDVNVRARQVVLSDGRTLSFDRLLLATGAEPIKLEIPGAGQPNVHTLRSMSDSRAIVANAGDVRQAVVLGASFIGLEVAASLRTRGIEVHVVAPGRRPLERVFGDQLGDFIRALHEEHGVIFHLGETAAAIDGKTVKLKGGDTLPADLVIAGIGVRPRTQLAERAGLAIDRGVVVNEHLETSASGIFSAGDIARWPDRYSGERLRIEHWVVAERQGQTAASNMLGQRQAFVEVPFFWSQHYDVPISYIGHAEKWDTIDIEGDIGKRDCLVRYRRNGKILAVASIFRDVDSLRHEVMMERAMPGSTQR
jgi:NADPH-dependent 2,4-dienoyl-CoA reductase/sulfur reductase-like enzyme/nitrite reductase/ring-hydroxylating ferredoxin subunit